MAMTDQDAAYMAAQWASGVPQRVIAQQFGYATGSPVSSYIAVFLARWSGVPDATIYGNERKKLVVPIAIRQYLLSRNDRYSDAPDPGPGSPIAASRPTSAP